VDRYLRLIPNFRPQRTVNLGQSNGQLVNQWVNMLDEGVAMIFFIAIFCAQKVKPARCRDLSFGKVNYAEKSMYIYYVGGKGKGNRER